MMAALFAWFMKDRARIAGAGLLVLAVLVIGHQQLRIISLNYTIATLQKQAAEKDQTVGQLRLDLASDRAALQKYADLSEAARASQAAAEARAAQSASAAKKALATLKSRPKPTDCASAAAYGVDAAEEILRGWK